MMTLYRFALRNSDKTALSIDTSKLDKKKVCYHFGTHRILFLGQ